MPVKDPEQGLPFPPEVSWNRFAVGCTEENIQARHPKAGWGEGIVWRSKGKAMCRELGGSIRPGLELTM